MLVSYTRNGIYSNFFGENGLKLYIDLSKLENHLRKLESVLFQLQNEYSLLF